MWWYERIHNRGVNSRASYSPSRLEIVLFTDLEWGGGGTGGGSGIVRLVERRTRDRWLQVRIPAGAAGAFSPPESTLCADSYSVSDPPPFYRSGT